MLDLSADDLLNIRNFGQKSLEELQGKLAELGVSSQRSTGVDFADEYLSQPGTNLVFDPDPDEDYDYDYDDGE